jgi:hypothetical protein
MCYFVVCCLIYWPFLIDYGRGRDGRSMPPMGTARVDLFHHFFNTDFSKKIIINTHELRNYFACDLRTSPDSLLGILEKKLETKHGSFNMCNYC